MPFRIIVGGPYGVLPVRRVTFSRPLVTQCAQGGAYDFRRVFPVRGLIKEAAIVRAERYLRFFTTDKKILKIFKIFFDADWHILKNKAARNLFWHAEAAAEQIQNFYSSCCARWERQRRAERRARYEAASAAAAVARAAETAASSSKGDDKKKEILGPHKFHSTSTAQGGGGKKKKKKRWKNPHGR